MNVLIVFLLNLAATLLGCFLIISYLRPHLRRILVDLCGTDDRARFWLAFSNILLLGIPLIMSLGYRPVGNNTETLLFDLVSRLGFNLSGLLFAVVVVGFVITFFSLIAPKPVKELK